MRGVRRKLRGSADKPRLSVYRSNKNLSCQAINDADGITITAVSSLEKAFQAQPGSSKSENAKALGQEMAKRLAEKGIGMAVFDRGWHKFHGRIKAFAEAVREGGIKF